MAVEAVGEARGRAGDAERGDDDAVAALDRGRDAGEPDLELVDGGGEAGPTDPRQLGAVSAASRGDRHGGRAPSRWPDGSGRAP